MSVIDPQLEARMKALVQKITYYNDLYYQKSISEISDHEFDTLLKQLSVLEENNPAHALTRFTHAKGRRSNH